MSDQTELEDDDVEDGVVDAETATGAEIQPAEEKPADLGKLPDPGLKGQPYQFDACTIGIAFTFLPDDNTGNRNVLVTVRSHEDLPAAMKLYRLSDLIGDDGQSFGKAPLVIAEMVEAMKEALVKRAATQKQAPRKTITVESGKPVQIAAPAASESKPNGQLGLF